MLHLSFPAIRIQAAPNSTTFSVRLLQFHLQETSLGVAFSAPVDLFPIYILHEGVNVARGCRAVVHVVYVLN